MPRWCRNIGRFDSSRRANARLRCDEGLADQRPQPPWRNSPCARRRAARLLALRRGGHVVERELAQQAEAEVGSGAVGILGFRAEHRAAGLVLERRSERLALGLLLAAGRAVGGPLGDVADQVVESQARRLELRDGRGVAEAVAAFVAV